MPPVLIDLVVMILLLGLTYALSSEGLWGSALMFFQSVSLKKQKGNGQ